MSRKDYDILGIPESATDEEVTARYEELKKKYSEDRFLEGEAGNEAARMLNRIEVAYNEIMTERGERHTADDMGGSYAKVDAYIREGKINEAENRLYEELDPARLPMLELALAFYSRLNQFDDAYLEAHNYSRQEIEEGLHAATKLFGIQLE